MDYTYIALFNKVIEELTYSSNVTLYIRNHTNKRYNSAVFVFNRYKTLSGNYKPYYLNFINFCRQIGYDNSGYCMSDEVRDAQEYFANKCKQHDCYCRPRSHHTQSINQKNVERYFEMVVDLGDV